MEYKGIIVFILLIVVIVTTYIFCEYKEEIRNICGGGIKILNHVNASGISHNITK